ncbi:hypothetical protein EDB86DRAFT_2935914 [Lactarius hatsudake]|nr:hypothetical protein EDB86DRAFT_2935914 [Lactarius hatsudake]
MGAGFISRGLLPPLPIAVFIIVADPIFFSRQHLRKQFTPRAAVSPFPAIRREDEWGTWNPYAANCPVIDNPSNVMLRLCML